MCRRNLVAPPDPYSIDVTFWYRLNVPNLLTLTGQRTKIAQVSRFLQLFSAKLVSSIARHLFVNSLRKVVVMGKTIWMIQGEPIAHLPMQQSSITLTVLEENNNAS